MHGGKVVFEKYDNGYSGSTKHMLASGSKSFTGLMAASAIQDGLLKSLDEKASDTLTEWKSDSRKSKITIRQLLNLSSGIPGGEIALGGRGWQTYAEAIKTPCNFEPGTKFQYGPTPFLCFGEIMRRKLLPNKESVEGYLKRRILEPIKVSVNWRNCPDGNPALPGGASMSAKDWAIYGLFISNAENFGGKQLIRASLIAECFKPSPANADYGMSWWIAPDPSTVKAGLGKRIQPNWIPSDYQMAAGAGKQHLILIPSMELVVVRMGTLTGKSLQFTDVGLLKALLNK